MDQIDLLAGVLTKTGDVIEGVRPEQAGLPTPCPEFDVDTLVNHIVGWIQVFEAAGEGRAFEGDPSKFSHGADPAAQFRSAADGLVAGYRQYGTERTVRLTSGEMPGAMAFDMTLMEYMTHGIDLAVATSQPVPYTEAEATETLARAEKVLPPEYRGDDKPFGHVVAIPASAPAVDRLSAFLGRTPASRA
jgi:uncharacterized protein (TIGR03086 family)